MGSSIGFGSIPRFGRTPGPVSKSLNKFKTTLLNFLLTVIMLKAALTLADVQVTVRVGWAVSIDHTFSVSKSTSNCTV